MIVKAQTEYTEDLIRNFAAFNITRVPKKLVTYALVEIAMAAIAARLIFVMRDTNMLIVSVLLGLLLLAVIPFMLWRAPAQAAKRSKEVFGTTVNYTFDDHDILIESSLPSVDGELEKKYTYFDRVYETKNVFYLYTSTRQAFVLSKSSITEGSPSDLRELFRKNLSADRFIVRNK